MPDQPPNTSPQNSLSETIYPQPTTTAGRGQPYSRTPIELPPLPIEQKVTSIPWRNLLFMSGLAALTMSGIDWLIGVWAGSDEGSLDLAIIGPFIPMIAIAGLSWVFYRTVTNQLMQANLPYVRSIIWSSILFILPVTQGLRWLVMPELLTHTMPITSHGITYLILVTTVWVGATGFITYTLLRSKAARQRRHRIVAWMVITPYIVALPLGIIALVKAINVFP